MSNEPCLLVCPADERSGRADLFLGDEPGQRREGKAERARRHKKKQPRRKDPRASLDEDVVASLDASCYGKQRPGKPPVRPPHVDDATFSKSIRSVFGF